MAKILTEKPDQYLTLEWSDPPRDANFWISGACNFSCVYCLHELKAQDPAGPGQGRAEKGYALLEAVPPKKQMT